MWNNCFSLLFPHSLLFPFYQLKLCYHHTQTMKYFCLILFILCYSFVAYSMFIVLINQVCSKPPYNWQAPDIKLSQTRIMLYIWSLFVFNATRLSELLLASQLFYFSPQSMLIHRHTQEIKNKFEPICQNTSTNLIKIYW